MKPKSIIRNSLSVIVFCLVIKKFQPHCPNLSLNPIEITPPIKVHIPKFNMYIIDVNNVNFS